MAEVASCPIKSNYSRLYEYLLAEKGIKVKGLAPFTLKAKLNNIFYFFKVEILVNVGVLYIDVYTTSNNHIKNYRFQQKENNHVALEMFLDFLVEVEHVPNK
jgi:hypothetical protein